MVRNILSLLAITNLGLVTAEPLPEQKFLEEEDQITGNSEKGILAELRTLSSYQPIPEYYYECY